MCRKLVVCKIFQEMHFWYQLSVFHPNKEGWGEREELFSLKISFNGGGAKQVSSLTLRHSVHQSSAGHQMGTDRKDQGN